MSMKVYVVRDEPNWELKYPYNQKLGLDHLLGTSL